MQYGFMYRLGKGIWFSGTLVVEHTGFEPVTSTLPVWRAPNCANAPIFLLY